MQYVDFFGKKVSKIVLGDNSMTGHSYITHVTPGAEMVKFYTAEKIKETLRYAESLGVNTMRPLSHPYMLRVLMEHVEAGGQMQFILYFCNRFGYNSFCNVPSAAIIRSSFTPSCCTFSPNVSIISTT